MAYYHLKLGLGPAKMKPIFHFPFLHKVLFVKEKCDLTVLSQMKHVFLLVADRRQSSFF